MCSFYGWVGAKAETPVLWPPHVKSWLIGKNHDAGRDWGQEEKGTTEDEMAGWHHWLDGRESEWTPGVGDGQGGLTCCNSWGREESDTTEWLNWRVIGYSFSECRKIISIIYWCKLHYSLPVKKKQVQVKDDQIGSDQAQWQHWPCLSQSGQDFVWLFFSDSIR